MKKAIIICFLVFFSLGILFILFFGKTKIKKNTSMKVYLYEDSPLYKKILQKNDTVIYINMWASFSPDSIERYQELIKDKKKKVYNFSVQDDSVIIKKAIKKYGMENDITLENIDYQKEILKNLYFDSYFSIGIVQISSTRIPKTFIFEKQMLKKDF
ncbi:hypothetical protein GCM10022217_03820 [Chryseobacterium ginsenosidimutans]|jgi:hypothetical protein|uniref:hypothetical protein n=1 Tax=Chryseobacterium ginsenosidimutans TaxID=687846 RepID=UPI0031DD4242